MHTHFNALLVRTSHRAKHIAPVAFARPTFALQNLTLLYHPHHF